MFNKKAEPKKEKRPKFYDEELKFILKEGAEHGQYEEALAFQKEKGK